jgi:hypothetical protein
MMMGMMGPVFSENGAQNHFFVGPPSSGSGGPSKMPLEPSPSNDNVLHDYYFDSKPVSENLDMKECVEYIQERRKELDDQYLLALIKSNNEIGLFTMSYALSQLNTKIRNADRKEKERLGARKKAGGRLKMSYLPWVAWPALIGTLAAQILLPSVLVWNVTEMSVRALQDEASGWSALQGICVFTHQTEVPQHRIIMASLAVVFMARIAVMGYLKWINMLSAHDDDDDALDERNMNNLLRMCYTETKFELPSGHQVKLCQRIFWFLWIDFCMDAFYEPCVYVLNLWLVFLTADPIDMVSTVCVFFLLASSVHAIPRARSGILQACRQRFVYKSR